MCGTVWWVWSAGVLRGTWALEVCFEQSAVVSRHWRGWVCDYCEKQCESDVHSQPMKVASICLVRCRIPCAYWLTQWLMHNLCPITTCRMSIKNSWTAGSLVLTGEHKAMCSEITHAILRRMLNSLGVQRDVSDTSCRCERKLWVWSCGSTWRLQEMDSCQLTSDHRFCRSSPSMHTKNKNDDIISQ